jgi:hypothetical protein
LRNLRLRNETTFPTTEKAAKMSPSYKSEDKTALDNYRPISGLPVFSKVLEIIVYNRFSTTSRKTNFLLIPSMDFVNSDQPSTPWQSSWTTLEGQVFLDLHSEPHTSPHQTMSQNSLASFNEYFCTAGSTLTFRFTKFISHKYYTLINYNNPVFYFTTSNHSN